MLISISGCAVLWFGAGIGLGIGGYKYLNGRLEVTYAAPFIRVFDASKSSLKELQINIIKEYRDLIDGEIIGKKADGKQVEIKIKNKGPNLTWLSIRVGILGDRDESMIIKKKIDAYVGLQGRNF